MITGVLFTAAACFCWSLVFVIPSFLENFQPLEIALGRFFIYGLISFSFLALKRRELFAKKYTLYWKKASYLSLLSTVICYTGTVLNMKYAGPAVATLVFATVPIFIALGGNLHKKEFPSQKLFLPLSLILFGVFFAKFKGIDDSLSISSFLLGLFFGLIGLISWTWFAVENAHFLKQNKEISITDWSLILGTATFFHVIVIGTAFILFSEESSKYLTFTPEIQKFLFLSIILGSFCTWLAFFLWNKGGKMLPISLTGQLMVFEIIFALFLIYSLEGTWPGPMEWTGVFLMLAGVFLGFKKLQHLNNLTSN